LQIIPGEVGSFDNQASWKSWFFKHVCPQFKVHKQVSLYTFSDARVLDEHRTIDKFVSNPQFAIFFAEVAFANRLRHGLVKESLLYLGNGKLLCVESVYLVYTYDITKDQICKIDLNPPLSWVKRGHARVAGIGNNKIFVVFFALDDRMYASESCVLSLDLQEHKWTWVDCTGRCMPYQAKKSCQINSTIYFVEGYIDRDIYSLNVDTKVWNVLNSEIFEGLTPEHMVHLFFVGIWNNFAHRSEIRHITFIHLCFGHLADTSASATGAREWLYSVLTCVDQRW